MGNIITHLLFLISLKQRFYEVILKRSHEFMESTNIIAFEIGETQATEIETLAKKEYPNANVIVKKDLQERNRYLFIINDAVS